MLRFGVLGAGRIGKVHAKALHDSGRARVAYVADAIADAAASLAATVGAATAGAGVAGPRSRRGAVGRR